MLHVCLSQQTCISEIIQRMDIFTEEFENYET